VVQGPPYLNSLFISPRACRSSANELEPLKGQLDELLGETRCQVRASWVCAACDGLDSSWIGREEGGRFWSG